jgi:transposase
MVRWGKTLRRWKVYLLNYFEHHTTNAYTEGVHTKIRLLKRVSYGLRNIEVYVKKMCSASFRLCFSIFTTLFD